MGQTPGCVSGLLYKLPLANRASKLDVEPLNFMVLRDYSEATVVFTVLVYGTNARELRFFEKDSAVTRRYKLAARPSCYYQTSSNSTHV
jgi:hypothetical protein